MFSPLADNQITLLAAAGIGVAGQEGQSLMSGLDQDLIHFIWFNDLRIDYRVMQGLP